MQIIKELGRGSLHSWHDTLCCKKDAYVRQIIPVTMKTETDEEASLYYASHCQSYRALENA